MKHQKSARALSALAGVLALGLAGLAVQAQTPPPSGPSYGPGPGSDYHAGTNAMDGMTEGRFVRSLDAIVTAELDISKYVVNRTKNADVHAYAQHMIEDYSTSAVKLEAATRGTNLRPAPRDHETNAMSRSIVAMLQSETGTQMDNDYMRVQVPGHKHELELLLWEQQNGANLGLKALAASLAPTVQQNLSLAQHFLAAHNLTPYAPPMTNPVPGNVNPTNNSSQNGTSNNPASSSNGTSPGQNSPTGTQPAPGSTPSVPFSNGTAAPAASSLPSAAPAPSSSPRP